MCSSVMPVVVSCSYLICYSRDLDLTTQCAWGKALTDTARVDGTPIFVTD